MTKKKFWIELTDALRAPITDRASAEAFIRELHGLDLGHHFDDGARECLRGIVRQGDAALIEHQVADCYAHWKSRDNFASDCPIGYALDVMAEIEGKGLVERLAAKYPTLEFAMSRKDDVGCSDEDDAPRMLVTFTGPHEMCIVDPLSDGFDACDPKEVYGLDSTDAHAIRNFNHVVIA